MKELTGTQFDSLLDVYGVEEPDWEAVRWICKVFNTRALSVEGVVLKPDKLPKALQILRDHFNSQVDGVERLEELLNKTNHE